jgi:hypothetical protein
MFRIKINFLFNSQALVGGGGLHRAVSSRILSAKLLFVNLTKNKHLIGIFPTTGS